MKAFDRILQKWRVYVAREYIQKGNHILDIGSYDGALFKLIGNDISGVGIDPNIIKTYKTEWYQLIPGYFPNDFPYIKPAFDVITLLAVVEHVPELELPNFVKTCVELLKPGGKIIITVPSKYVDNILKVLTKFKIVDGMSIEEHHQFIMNKVKDYFMVDGIKLEKHRKFQFGLNNLFVFQKKNNCD